MIHLSNVTAAVCRTFYLKANPEESAGRDSSGQVVVDLRVNQR